LPQVAKFFIAVLFPANVFNVLALPTLFRWLLNLDGLVGVVFTPTREACQSG
jgi:hypothetical protein